jgi:cytochrome b561
MNFDTIKTLIVLAVVVPAALVIVWALASWSWRKSGVDRPWSSLSKLFHWAIAGSVVLATVIMYYMINLGDTTVPEIRAEYSRLLKTHKSVGLIVLFLVAFRFAWNRWRARPPVADSLTPLQRRASASMHGLLYGFMLVVPLLGWMASMTYGGKTSFFGLFELPVWLPKNIEWANVLQPAHVWLAWGMVVFVGVHFAAALWHHLVRRDATLERMLPRRRGSDAA